MDPSMDQQSNLPQQSAPPGEQITSQQELPPSQVIVSQSQNISLQQTQNIVVDNSMIQNMMIDNEHSKVVLVTVPEGIGSSVDGEVEIIVTTHLTADGEKQLYELPTSGTQYQHLESASGSNIALQHGVYKYTEAVLPSHSGSDPSHLETLQPINSTANAIYDSALSSGIIPATQPNTVICSSSVSASDIVSVLHQQQQEESVTAGELVTAFATANQSTHEDMDQSSVINQQTVIDQSNSQSMIGQPITQSVISQQPLQSLMSQPGSKSMVGQPHQMTTAQQMISLSRYPTDFNENQTSHEVVQMTVESSQSTVSSHAGPQTGSSVEVGPQVGSNPLAGPQPRSAAFISRPRATPGVSYPQRSLSQTQTTEDSLSPEQRSLYEKQETMKSLELVEAQWRSSVQSSQQSAGLKSPSEKVLFPTQDNQVTTQEGDMFSYEVVDIKVETETEKSMKNNENVSPNPETILTDSIQIMDGGQAAGEKTFNKTTCSTESKSEKSVQKPPNFKCTLCQKTFYEIDELNVHVNSHRRNQSFKCSKCDLMFVSAASLKKHETIHSELSGFKCDDCGKTFGSKGYLKSHLRTHATGKAHNCDDCTLSFMTAKALNKHKVANCTREKKFCDICSETFASTHLLEQHVLKQHTKQSAPAVSKATRGKGKKTLKVTASQMKMKTSTSTTRPVTRGETKKEASKKKVPSFNCMICKERFASKALLKEHARTHLGQRVLRCDKCGKVFQDSIKMKMHKLTHSGQSYYCDFCGKIFNYASTLAVHKKTHENEKGFKCRTCKSRFATAEMLKNHKSTHASTKTFICDICEKAFTSQYYLKTHKRLHTGEKHYGCLQCGESFMFSNGLRRHVIKAHSAEEASTSAPREVHADDNDDYADYSLPDTGESFDPIFDMEKMKVLQDMASPKRDEDGMFECRWCEKKFQSMPAVNNHMKEHVELPFTCNICKKTFSCNLYLQKHLKRHDDKKKFECDICKKSFRSSGYLAQHQKIHTGEKNYACQLCGEEFTFANSLRRHLHNHKDLGPNIQGLVSKKNKLYRPVNEIDDESRNIPTCNLCGYTFESSSLLNEHMESHSGENPVYECRVCKKEFNSHRALLKHKQIHVDNKPISCEICNKTFRASYYLKSHMNIHNGHKPYKCKYCDESFTYASTRRRHMRVHIPEESMEFMCSMCGKKFFNRGECDRHMMGHSNEKSFMCDICGKTFGNKTLLRNHMKRHNGERQYQCHMCTKTFLHRYRLHRHIKTHTGEKSYKCNICEKGFLTQAYLSTHLRSHTGEKPYKCEVCGEEFSFSNTFRRHKRIHSGLTLNCGVCGKMCLELFDLKRHMQSHSDQKTVMCDYCGKGFSHQGSCKRHIRRTHPEMVMPFPVENVNLTVEVS